MAPVQLLFVYQDDCIFQPYELFLDVEPTCHAEMKPVAWRFVLYPEQFVLYPEQNVSLQPVDEDRRYVHGDFGVAWLSVFPVALKLL